MRMRQTFGDIIFPDWTSTLGDGKRAYESEAGSPAIFAREV
jgi:hypothetical protein